MYTEQDSDGHSKKFVAHRSICSTPDPEKKIESKLFVSDKTSCIRHSKIAHKIYLIPR